MRRMTVRGLLVWGVLVTTACSPGAMRPQQASWPAAILGTDRPKALALAAADWSDVSRMYGRPQKAICAIAVIEYLATQSGDTRIDPMADEAGPPEILLARTDMRAALAIPPGIPPQAILDALTHAERFARDGDQAMAAAVFTPPIFTLGPAATWRTLSALPYLRSVNLATAKAGNDS